MSGHMSSSSSSSLLHSPEFSANNVLTVTTVQIAAIKTLFTALKEILLESNIVFGPDGIRIVNMDKTMTVFVHVHLQAPRFEFYDCKKANIVLGANMLNLNKFISFIESDETFTMYIAKEDYVGGFVSQLSFLYENGKLQQSKTLKMRLNEPDSEHIELPSNMHFSCNINMPSTDFSRLIRNCSDISDKLEFKSVDQDVYFSLRGDMGSYQVHRVQTAGTGTGTGTIYQGIFSLKHLGYVYKCTPMCPNVDIFLNNDYPLVIRYMVANLGEFKLCLSPLADAAVL